MDDGGFAGGTTSMRRPHGQGTVMVFVCSDLRGWWCQSKKFQPGSAVMFGGSSEPAMWR